MVNFTPDLRAPEPEDFLLKEPIRLFDDLYFVGNRFVGTWIIPTNAGLVLLEGSDQVDYWETSLKPALDQLGFGEEKVLAMLITHGHMDHYAGCDHIRRATGCDICLSRRDTLHITSAVENLGPNKDTPIPQITRFVEPGDELVFGDHVISVLDGSGHTPGCLNYSMEVHDGDESHRFIMMGGFGIFGPGNFMGLEYTYGTAHAVEAALRFATTCVMTWEYAKTHHCDVFLNPHPHLCRLHEYAQKNAEHKAGETNAFVVGTDGVRQWIMERFDDCMRLAAVYTDIREEYKEENK